MLFATQYLEAAVSLSKSEIKVDFGTCPKKPTGDFVFKTSKIFEKNRSLKEVKIFATENRLKQKHFLRDYKITYNPVKKTLNYFLECSEPILKVSAIAEKGKIAYDVVLSEDGHTHDPSYLVYLRSEDGSLNISKAALPVDMMTKANKDELVLLARQMKNLNKISLRELIFTKTGEMTMIIGKKKKIISVFLGKSFWKKKLDKLDKIISYLDAKQKTPSLVNLTDMEKAVIKF